MAGQINEAREYRDPNVSSVTITNDGTPQFSVWVQTPGGWAKQGEFEAVENPDSPYVSEKFARERADQYFQRLKRRDLVGELSAQTPYSQTESRLSVHEKRIDALLESGRKEEAARRLQESDSAAHEIVRRLLDN